MYQDNQILLRTEDGFKSAKSLDTERVWYKNKYWALKADLELVHRILSRKDKIIKKQFKEIVKLKQGARNEVRRIEAR